MGKRVEFASPLGEEVESEKAYEVTFLDNALGMIQEQKCNFLGKKTFVEEERLEMAKQFLTEEKELSDFSIIKVIEA